MNKEELKEMIRQKVEEFEDEADLQMLYEAVTEYDEGGKSGFAHELTPEQLERLQQSKAQHRNGNVYTHSEVQKKIRNGFPGNVVRYGID